LGLLGSPPGTEDALPIVVAPLDGSDVTSLLFQFSRPLTTFGMEPEPDDLAAREIVVQFFSGGVSQGTLALLVQGNSGARLFAAGGGVFDSVQVSSDTDFAAAEFRYVVATPEPGSLWLLAGVLVAFGWRCQRRWKSKSQTHSEKA
jgi:PEP-CTERM motif